MSTVLDMYVGYGGGKVPWGNVTAYDVLNLTKNEGVNASQDFQLLFAGKSTKQRNYLVCYAMEPGFSNNLVTLSMELVETRLDKFLVNFEIQLLGIEQPLTQITPSLNN